MTNTITHVQMFKAADNDDGYVSVIVHRERYRDDLVKMGFVGSVEDLSVIGPSENAEAAAVVLDAGLSGDDDQQDDIDSDDVIRDKKNAIAAEALETFGVSIKKTKSLKNMRRELDELRAADNGGTDS